MSLMDPAQARTPVQNSQTQLSGVVQRRCDTCRKKTPVLQRTITGPVPETVPPIVHEVLRSTGQPLDHDTREFMEERFGYDFSRVRIHTDAKAAESARAVNARAYTVGQDIVFGVGQYTQITDVGRTLIAHELAHVAQHDHFGLVKGPAEILTAVDPSEREAEWAAAAIGCGQTAPVLKRPGRYLRREAGRPARPQSVAGPAAGLPQVRTFTQTWIEFERHRRSGRDTEAQALAADLVQLMCGDEAIEHACDLRQWLAEHRLWELAEQTLIKLEAAWRDRFDRLIGPGMPDIVTWLGRVDPEGLIRRAQQQAAGGQHDRARELLGWAFRFLQICLILQSDRWFTQLESMRSLPPGIDFPIIRLINYYEAGRTINNMREIIGFYSRQQRQALVAGRADDARQFETLDRQLRASLREQYLFTGRGEGSRAITMEATYEISQRRGEGYTLHGAGSAPREELVTPLPGEPRPDELGRHPAYSASMEEMLETIGGQEDFLTEITREPQIRAAFGNRPIQMNDLSTRLRVWSTMYAVYQSRPAPGCTTALCSLLRLMERYLHHFTMHTGYDIRDFGVSYLESEFPEDLLGRAVRDCGVYVLKVAYELYRTTRQATPRVPAAFQLYFTLDHATLIIFDTSTNDQYLVSNDQISGPRQGDPAGLAAIAYGSLMGYRHVTAIGARTERLTTDMSERTFRQEIWQRYQSGTRLTLPPEPLSGPGDTRSEAQRSEAAHIRYYDVQGNYNRLATNAEVRLNVLLRDLSGLPRREHNRLLAAQIGVLTQLGMAMRDIMRVFTRTSREGSIAGLRPGATRPVEQVGITASADPTANPPILRVAMALLYAQSIHTTLTQDQLDLIAWVRVAPWPSFGQALTEYERARRPASF